MDGQNVSKKIFSDRPCLTMFTGSVILKIVDFISLACQRKPLSGQAGEMERAVPPKFGSFATREGAEKEGVIHNSMEVQYRNWLTALQFKTNST